MNYPKSTDKSEYEILIRRRDENDYASYCPQLAYMIKGRSHEEVEQAMQRFIHDYISQLSVPKQEND